jgi:hypothetical protein
VCSSRARDTNPKETQAKSKSEDMGRNSVAETRDSQAREKPTGMWESPKRDFKSKRSPPRLFCLDALK